MTKREIAGNYFKEGYNCAQAVALAFSEEIKMDKKTKVGSIYGKKGWDCFKRNQMSYY